MPPVFPKFSSAASLEAALRDLGTDERATQSARFFKTGPGQYAEGERFLGVRVPDQRKLAKRARGLPMSDVIALLQRPWHECRLTGVFVLVDRYQRGNEVEREAVFTHTMRHIDCINNWDLVDAFAPKIVGPHLPWLPSDFLDQLATSGRLWRQRIAMVATLHPIGNDAFDDALRIARMLLGHQHDLIHKAVGWMLREIGKRDESVLEAFLKRHLDGLPRTTLRYAIERMPRNRRTAYLKGIP